MGNGKFPAGDRNTLKHIQSPKFSVGSCNAKFLKASSNSGVTDI